MNKPKDFPNAFYFCIGGYFQGFRSLRLKDLAIVDSQPADARRPHKRDIRESAPDEKAWRQFWRSVDRIGVWDWQRRYDTPGVLDGTDWYLLLRYQGRNLRSGGCNGYPKKGEHSSDFEGSDLEKLAKALNRLTGSSELFY